MEKHIEQVTTWILHHHPEIDHISTQTDLIDSRLVDSLRFMELIFFLEKISGQQIDTNQLNIDDFRTIDNIKKKFLNS